MSDAWQFLSRAERFRLKAGECRNVAESARLPQTRVIFANLARSYGRLAAHEESLEAVIKRSAPQQLWQRLPTAVRTAARQEVSLEDGLGALQPVMSERQLARLLA